MIERDWKIGCTDFPILTIDICEPKSFSALRTHVIISDAIFGDALRFRQKALCYNLK